MQKLWVKVFIFYSFIEVYASFVEIIRKKKIEDFCNCKIENFKRKRIQGFWQWCFHKGP